MAHGLYAQNGGSSTGARRRGERHDVRYDGLMSVEKNVVGRTSSPPGTDYAHEHQRALLHRHRLPVPTSVNSPRHGAFPVTTWEYFSVPVRRWRTNDGTTRGMDIDITISEHHDYDDDHWLGRGQQHQHYQGDVGDGGVGQHLHDVEVELHRPAVVDKQRPEDERPLFFPTKEPIYFGSRDGGVGGGGASNREHPRWYSSELDVLGRRKMSMQPTKSATEPMSAKVTMIWPRVDSTSWQSTPHAPLPQLPSPHQPQESGDENKFKIIAIPERLETPRTAKRDAASQDVYGRSKRTGGGQRLKRTCQHPDCRRSPSFSKPEQRAVYCAKHKLDGMVNVVSRKCAVPGCGKGPSYGQPGDKKPVFCSGHRLPGHVNVVSPTCAQDGCRTGPSFGLSGTGNRATYCAKHKLAGMVNVVSKSCKEDGCNSAPSFGFEGERATLCGRHKRDGQRNLISRRCTGPDCSKVPSYGKTGDPRPTFCTYHKPPEAINLLSPRCAAAGCDKIPVKEKTGRKNRYCRVHSV